MRVAALQHDIVWRDRAANLGRLRPEVERAAGAGADLVLLTETYSTGFATDADDLGEAPDGPSATFLVESARRLGVWVGATYPELPPGGQAGARPTNCFTLAGPAGEVHRYHKRHRFGFGGEDRVFDAGTELVTVEVAGLRCGLFVCYDLRFADDFWALAPDVDVYLVPANWPAARRQHWRSLLVARAIENQAWVVGVNRVGEGGGIAYAGDTMVIDPLGEVVASASATPTIVLADLDAATVADVRARYPFLADRDL